MAHGHTERRLPTVDSRREGPDFPPHDQGRLKVVSLHDRGGLVARLDGDPQCAQPRFLPIADLKRGVPAGDEIALSIDGSDALAPHEWSKQVHVGSVGAVEAQLVRTALACRDALPDGAY